MREEAEDDALIYFGVVDSGVGISQETEQTPPTLFKSTAVTRQHGGTGLGLAISKQLSELMGGQIGVESEIGTAVLFGSVRLQKQIGSGHDFPPANSISIVTDLVIDGDETTRSLICEQLQVGVFPPEAPPVAKKVQTLDQTLKKGCF